MHDPFTGSSKGESSPNMLMTAGSGSNMNPADYRYRIERFELGSQETDDECAALESLLDRSLTPEVMIIERKDSISATTGVYTCVIIYLELRPTARNRGEQDA